jgi:SAM-dependent methyltransferase
VSFEVSADDYLRFMGPYSQPLAARFCDLAGIRGGQRVLDVGCGPGPLTAELVSRAGAAAVSAVEPSASFAAAARQRWPEVDIRRCGAERLPFPDGAFDAALAQRFTLGVGPSGDYVAALTQDQRHELRERCRRLLPDGPVEVIATTWAATARPAPAGGLLDGVPVPAGPRAAAQPGRLPAGIPVPPGSAVSWPVSWPVPHRPPPVRINLSTDHDRQKSVRQRDDTPKLDRRYCSRFGKRARLN